MKLSGPGPWGVQDVSRATGIPARTLHRWHRQGHATATDRTSRKGCLRYQREDVARICQLAAAKDEGIGSARAARVADGVQRKLERAFHRHRRPVIA